MREGSRCVDADATTRTGPLDWSWRLQSPPDLRPGGGVALYTSELPLAQKPWQVTMKPKGHRHMDPIQHAMPGVKEKMVFLENLGRNGSCRRGCRLFRWKSKRSKSDVCSDSVTQEIISQKGQRWLPTSLCAR